MVKLDTASSGAGCIELHKNNSCNIVFLDHMMPEMYGLETLKKIRKEKIAQNTCFIALTANAIYGARQTYLDAGFDDYLSQPFSGVEIEKCLFGHLPESLWEYVRNDEKNAPEIASKAEKVEKHSFQHRRGSKIYRRRRSGV